MKNINKLIKKWKMKAGIYRIFFCLWISCVLIFIPTVIYSEILNKTNKLDLLIDFSIIVGVISFIMMILSNSYFNYKKTHIKTSPLKFIVFLLLFPFLPLFKLIKYFCSKKKKKKDKPKIFNVLFLFFLVGPIWIGDI